MINAARYSQQVFEVEDWLTAYDAVLQDCESLASQCRGIEPVVQTIHMLAINASHAVTKTEHRDGRSVLASIVTDLQSGQRQLASCVEQLEYKVTHIEMKASTLVLNLSRSKTDIRPERLLFNLHRETSGLLVLLKQLEHLFTPIKQWSKKASYISVISAVDSQQDGGQQRVIEDITVKLQAWGEGVEQLIKVPMQSIVSLNVGLSQQLEQLDTTRLTLLDCA